MGRLVAETGVPPRELLHDDVDEAMLMAITAQVTEMKKEEAETWTTERELLATLVELSHAHLIAFINANSKRGVKSKPLHIPRPWDEKVDPDKPMGIREFAQKTR